MTNEITQDSNQDRTKVMWNVESSVNDKIDEIADKLFEMGYQSKIKSRIASYLMKLGMPYFELEKFIEYAGLTYRPDYQQPMKLAEMTNQTPELVQEKIKYLEKMIKELLEATR